MDTRCRNVPYGECTLCSKTVCIDELTLLACDEVCPDCMEDIGNDLARLQEDNV